MDHIPKPSGPHIAPIEVPLLAKLEYDFKGFDSFPYRHGFVKDGKLNRARSLDDLAALLQSWLYFGLISEYTMKPIKAEDFVYDSASTGSAYVSSNRLFDLLNEWNCRLRQLRMISSSWKNTVTATRSLLLVAERASYMFDNLPGFDQPRYAAVALSVKILLITLFSTYNLLLPEIELNVDDFHLRPWHESHDLTMPQPARYLQEVLQVRDWCPALIQRILKRYSYHTVMFLAQIPRNEPADVSHAHCSFDECVAYNISENTYRTRHVEENCQCPSVSVPTDRVAKLIQEGQIPLVEIRMNPRPSMSVLPAISANAGEARRERLYLNQYGPFRNYIAISHVWADGLGNPNSNGLPQCQIARIARFVLPKLRNKSKVRNEHVLIWMDTLCIPVGQQYSAVRLKAIDQMALIFASADDVLVLDRNLAQLRRPQVGLIEYKDPPAIGLQTTHPFYLRHQAFYTEWAAIFGRILCSPWAGRSWTLQEAVIPHHVQFALRDGVVASQRIDAAAAPLNDFTDIHANEQNIFSDLLSNLRVSIVRILSTGSRLCCVSQLYTKFRAQVARSWSTTETTRWIHCVDCFIDAAYLLLAVIASLEITALHALYFLTMVSIYVVASPLALLLWMIALLFIPLHMAIMSKADRRWLQARLESNRVEDIMRHVLFMNLAKATRDLLHLESKALVVAARGRRDVLDKAHSSRLAHVWNSLSDRSTTKPDDLHYILSILTDRHVQFLKSIAPHKRMEVILKTFKCIPAGLLFAYDARTMTSHISDNQWLPVTPRGWQLNDRALLRAHPLGFELCAGDHHRYATVYINEQGSHAANFAMLFGPSEASFYQVETLRTAEAFPSNHQPTTQRKTCSLVLGARQKQLKLPSCLRIVQFEILHQEPLSVQLRYKSLLLLQRIEPENTPRPVVSYLDLKETLPHGTRYIISHGSPTSTSINNVSNYQHEYIEPGDSSYQPPFGLTATLAHYTLLRLLNINLGVLFIPGIVILACRNADAAKIAGIIIIGISWLLIFSGYRYLRAECLSIAWHAYYDAIDPIPRSNLMIKLNAFMENWDRTIATNFPLSDVHLMGLQDGWSRIMNSPEQLLATSKRGASLSNYLLPFIGTAGLDMENSTGNASSAAVIGDVIPYKLSIRGLATPTLKASLDSRLLRRMGLGSA